MSKFARGDKALGECARSGIKMPYKQMVRDGYLPNLMVHPAWREPAHPQDRPKTFIDPEALSHPSPENLSSAVNVRLPVYDLETGSMSPDFTITVTTGQAVASAS